MTKHHLARINVAEIKTLELRCTECAGMVAYPLGYAAPSFLKCPGCGKTLVDSGELASTIFKLHAALTAWNRIAEKPLTMTFTVDFPNE